MWSTVDIWCSSAKITAHPDKMWYIARGRSGMCAGWQVQLPEGVQVSVILCLTCLGVLVWIRPIISDLYLLFCHDSCNICQYTRKLQFSALKVICAAGAGGSVKHSEGLRQRWEVCWVCLKKLLVSVLLHGGKVSASGHAGAGAAADCRGTCEGATVKGTWFVTEAQRARTFSFHVRELRFESKHPFQDLGEMTIPRLSE